MDIEDVLLDEFGILTMPGVKRGKLRGRAITHHKTYEAIRDRLAEWCDMEPDQVRLSVPALLQYVKDELDGEDGNFEGKLEHTDGLDPVISLRENFGDFFGEWEVFDWHAFSEGWAFAFLYNHSAWEAFGPESLLFALLDARQVQIMFKLEVALCMLHCFNKLPRGRVSRIKPENV